MTKLIKKGLKDNVNCVKKILNLFDKQFFMKLITLLLLINCTFSFSQNYFTRGEVFGFDVGDIIQTRDFYSIRNTYITRKYLEKNFSSNNDSVFYLIERKIYTPQFTQQGSTSFSMDTVTESYGNLNDTIHYFSPPILTYEDSLWHFEDTLYTSSFADNCSIDVYNIYFSPMLPCFECSFSSESYIKGLGYYKYEYGYLTGLDLISIGTSLHYYKKGNQECGTFKNFISELDLSNEVQLYPNPSSEKIQIHSDFYFDAFEIFAIDGNKVQAEYLNKKEIEISDLKPGIYFLELKSKANTIARKRFVKN